MDIRHQRDVYLLFYAGKGNGCFHSGHRHPDDVAARLFQAVDLLHRCPYILCFCIAHGLDQDGIPAANDTVPNPYCLCMVPIHVSLSLLHFCQNSFLTSLNRISTIRASNSIIPAIWTMPSFSLSMEMCIRDRHRSDTRKQPWTVPPVGLQSRRYSYT